MANLRLYGLRGGPSVASLRVYGITGAVTQDAALRVYGITGFVAAPAASLRVYGITGAVAASAQFRIFGIVAAVTRPVVVAPVTLQTVEPYSSVAITVATSAGTATGWTWRQLSGPPVTWALSNGDKTATFTAPPRVTEQDIIFGITAHSDAGDSPERQAIVHVFAHTTWVMKAGAWHPARYAYSS